MNENQHNALPCPWCNSPARIYRTQRGETFGVQCSTLACDINTLGPHRKTIEEAVKVWNTRIGRATMKKTTFITTADMIEVGHYRIRVGAVGVMDEMSDAVSFRARDLILISTGKQPETGQFFSREELKPYVGAIKIENVYGYS